MCIDTPDNMIKHVANQHKKTPSRLKVPWWIILIVTASILPVLSWPLYMRNFNFTADDTHELYLLLAYLFDYGSVAKMRTGILNSA